MSKIVAIMPCRNSAWVLGLSARALLMWCDELVVLNHASTDNTAEIISDMQHEFPGRVGDMRTGDQQWREMAHRDSLLQSARKQGATHIVIVDDDELVSGNLLTSIRHMVLSTPRGAVLQLPWVQLKGSLVTYISSGMWSQQCASTAFPDDPAYHWAARNGYDHHNRHPMGKAFNCHMPLGRNVNAGGVLHLQMLSERRLKQKQYWYQIVERYRWPERETAAQVAARYTPTVESPGNLSLVPQSWMEPYADLMGHLNADAESWHLAEIRRMIAERPGVEVGLNSFGVEL